MDVTQNVGIDLFIGIGSLNAAFTRTYTKDGLLEDPDNVALRESLSEGREVELPPDLLSVHEITAENGLESDEVELHVNLGQVGFVFIEANVKKYGFGSVYGEIGIPPSYTGNEIKTDTILQRGEDIPPKYCDDRDTDDFFGNININRGRAVEGSSSNWRPMAQRALSVIPEAAESDLERYERLSSAYDRENNPSNTSPENMDPNENAQAHVTELELTDTRHNESSSSVGNSGDKRKKRKKKKRSKK